MKYLSSGSYGFVVLARDKRNETQVHQALDSRLVLGSALAVLALPCHTFPRVTLLWHLTDQACCSCRWP